MPNPAYPLDLDIYQFSQYRHRVDVVDTNDDAVDLTGYTAKLEIKDLETDAQLFAASNADYLSILPAGYVTIDIPDNITGAWTFDRGYYDLFIISPGGEPIPLVAGKVRVYSSAVQNP